MSRYLAVVERAFRGTLEEQYAHILWLCHAKCKMRGEVGVLLTGNAVLYAQEKQRTPTLTIGAIEIAHLPNYAAAVSRLLTDGIPVYASMADLERLQIQADELCKGVRPVSAQEVADLIQSYDGAWYW